MSQLATICLCSYYEAGVKNYFRTTASTDSSYVILGHCSLISCSWTQYKVSTSLDGWTQSNHLVSFSIMWSPGSCNHCQKNEKHRKKNKKWMVCALAVAHNLQWTVKPPGTLTSLSEGTTARTDNAQRKRQKNNEEGRSGNMFLCLIMGWGQGIYLNGFAAQHTQEHTLTQNTNTHFTCCYCWLLIISSLCIVGDSLFFLLSSIEVATRQWNTSLLLSANYYFVHHSIQ